MAPTLGLIKVADVSVDVAATENSQALQMSSSNRRNGETPHASVPHEQQTEHDVISHSNETLQASGEEQRLADTTPRGTITTQAHQAAAAQPFVNESPHPVTLRELLRVQEEQYASVSRAYEEIRTTAAQVRSTAMAQEQMVAQHQAAREASAAQMQAVLNQFDQVQEAQRRSDERAQKSDKQAQKTLEALEKMKEELKKREEELSMKVDETVKESLRAAVDEEFKKLPKVIKKEVKKEAKREKNKEEKAAGKPKKNWSLYNIHVMEEQKRLKELGSGEDLFQVASRSWKEIDEEERWARYGGIYEIDKGRYERELEVWWEEREVPVDQRKPAAKPTPEELVATVDPRESAADTPNAPPEESSHTAAAMGPGDPDEGSQLSNDDDDEGYELSSYEQMVQDNIARNEARMRSLDLLPKTGVESQENGGFLSRNRTSSGTSKKKKKKRNNRRARNQKYMRTRGFGEGSLSRLGDTALANSPVVQNRNTEELTSDTVGDLYGQGSPHSAANNKDDTDNRQDTTQPSPEESVAAAATEFRPRVVDDSLAGVVNTQEGSTRMPGLIAPNGAEVTRKEVAVSPPTTTVVIHRRQEVQGATAVTAPFLGVERNSEEEPPHVEKACRSSIMPEDASLTDTVVNNRDNADVAVGSTAACRLQISTASLTRNGDGNIQESPSVAARHPRGKKRKNHAPYWYKDAPVYELEGYTDGTPLPEGYVWVEYDSGTVVQVKDVDLAKKLPARISRPRLKHDLFSAGDTSRQAGGSSGNVPEAQTTLPETIYDCRRSSNNASEIPFPVGYRFYHKVSSGNLHRGYRCVAEVKEVIGDGEFAVLCFTAVVSSCCHKSNPSKMNQLQMMATSRLLILRGVVTTTI